MKGDNGEMHEVNMPKFGATMEDGEIVKWFKQPGDAVAKGEALVEIMTEKITNSLEAMHDGVVDKILVNEGEKANCGDVIAYIREA
jgi:pyruvate/2-oxoglutarate dehydrogenase complex dihydrolipoamide acyltransferase (E2) component